MKILTEKQQLVAKIYEIDNAMEDVRYVNDKTYNRLQTKRTWGIFSFICESQLSLNNKIENLKSQLNILQEYRDIISDRILKVMKE